MNTTGKRRGSTVVQIVAILLTLVSLPGHSPTSVAGQCQPMITREMVVFEVENGGTAQMTKTFRRTTGKSKTQTKTQGGGSSSSQSSGSESSSSSGKSIGGSLGFGGLGINAGYNSQSGSSSRSESSSSTNFNWENVDSSVYNDEVSSEDTFHCEAKSHCTVYQTVGECGGFIYKTPKTRVESKLIPVPTAAPAVRSDGLPVVTIQKPGEVWVLAKDLTFLNHTGDWQKTEVCPPSSFVNGFKTKSDVEKGTGLTGLSLTCSSRTSTSEYKPVKEIESESGLAGTWYQPFRSSSKTEYAHGFVHQEWTSKGGRKHKGNWKLKMHNQPNYLFLPKKSRDIKTHEVNCPDGTAICGIMTMMDDRTRNVITNIGFKCCFYCLPVQEFQTSHTYENWLPTEQKISRGTTVGVRKETSTSKGGQSSTDQSTTSEGKTLEGIQAGFAATFAKSTSQGFNWGNSESSAWNSETVNTFTWECPPKTKCLVKQLVGKCGGYTINTPYIKVVPIPLEIESTPEVSNLVEEE